MPRLGSQLGGRGGSNGGAGHHGSTGLPSSAILAAHSLQANLTPQQVKSGPAIPLWVRHAHVTVCAQPADCTCRQPRKAHAQIPPMAVAEHAQVAWAYNCPAAMCPNQMLSNFHLDR